MVFKWRNWKKLSHNMHQAPKKERAIRGTTVFVCSSASHLQDIVYSRERGNCKLLSPCWNSNHWQLIATIYWTHSTTYVCVHHCPWRVMSRTKYKLHSSMLWTSYYNIIGETEHANWVYMALLFLNWNFGRTLFMCT